MVNDEDSGIEPVLVRRTAYDAGKKLQEEAGGDRMPAIERARGKAEECSVAGDKEGAAFWNDVCAYLKDAEYASAGVETIILEEGESYDHEEGEVIRPGKNPPRSDKGSRSVD